MILSKTAFSRPRGNALVPVLLIAGALAVSVLVFFLVTKKQIDARHDAEVASQKPAETEAPQQESPKGENPKPQPSVAQAGTAPAAAMPAANPSLSEPKPAVEMPAAAIFSRPVEIGEQLARSLSAGDLAAAAKLLSAGDAAQEAGVKAMLDKVFTDLGYKVEMPAQIAVVGQAGTATRIAVPLVDPKAPKSSGMAIALDVERDPKMGFKVGQIRLPKELESIMAAALPDPAPAVPGAPPMPKPLLIVDKDMDPLGFAQIFVGHLLRLEYDKAVKLVDPERVAPVKLAGLCIVFEDGRYTLQENKPLVTTLSTEKTSWVIAKIHSEVLKEDTEFGLEMEKETEKGWRVVGLNMSKMLADNAKSSTLVGIPYSPLVLNPKGGESIALYYEYNQAELHPRAKKQLEIVASILKARPTRKLKIGGHTDALGTDAYNIDLSKRRAEAVKEFMIITGVPVDQVETIGFGKAAPLSPNVNPDGTDNPEGRSRNRRAEILLDF